MVLSLGQTLDLRGARSASLTLRGLELDSRQIEALEDVLKTVPLKLLDLGASHASDDVSRPDPTTHQNPIRP